MDLSAKSSLTTVITDIVIILTVINTMMSYFARQTSFIRATVMRDEGLPSMGFIRAIYNTPTMGA